VKYFHGVTSARLFVARGQIGLPFHGAALISLREQKLRETAKPRGTTRA
jgi:hypothetical protein